MTAATLTMCGIVLLTVVTIESGGVLLLRIASGAVPANALQRTYFRAGHAHAGVLIILGLVVQLLTSQPGVAAWAGWIGTGVLWAAILLPAGFFLSVIGKDPQRPNAWRYAIWAGALSLAVGLVGAAIGLIAAQPA
jgi:hypothetical protein